MKHIEDPFSPPLARPRLPAARLSRLWPVLTAAALLYGSWIPFDFDLARLARVAERALPPLGFPHSDLDDLLVNFAVYLPLGASIFARRRNSSGSPAGSIVLAALAGACVSFVAETLQTLSAVRLASWIDVVVNTIGCACGALAACVLLPLVGRILTQARRSFATAPMMALATLLSALWVVLTLAPFDLVPHTLELHDRFRDARWSPLPAIPRDVPQAVGRLQALAPLMIACACLTIARVAGGWSRPAALLSAAKHALVLAVLSEVMQIFTVSNRFELGAVAEAALAGLLGAALTLPASGEALAHGSSATLRLNRGFLPTLILLAAAYAALLPAALVGSLPAASAAVAAEAPRHVADYSFLPPFESLWRLSTVHALGELAGMVAQCGLLALLVLAALGGSRACRSPLAAMAATLLVAALPMVLESRTSIGAFDLTGPLLAVLIAAGVTRTYMLLRPQAAAQHLQIDRHQPT